MDDEIRAFALQNAMEHGGKASVGAVMGRAIGAFPQLKEDTKAAAAMIKGIVEEVNGLGPKEQEALLDRIGAPQRVKKEKKEDLLPELEGAVPGNVVMRFAPGPSGPLHIGHSRAALLNDEYCRRYKGRFILRLEDTNPEKIEEDAYSMIPEDLEWLGVEFHETFVQSDRMGLYYKATEDLIKKGAAYVCTIDTEIWRGLKEGGKPCEERSLPPEHHLERWEMMKEGAFSEGEAFLVIKTDLSHPNPAVRDFVGMRIREEPHLRTGDRFRVFPLYNLSVAVDDHLMGCTHILRGKDHLNNTLKQEYVYRHMEWDLPVFIHYGLVSIPDTLLKKSLITKELKEGRVDGWDDVRLGTLRALKARGYHPAALRKYWLDVGIKPVDISFSWETLNSIDKGLIDNDANRYFFVGDPVIFKVRTDADLTARIPLHPDHPDRGVREYALRPVDGFVHVSVPSSEIAEMHEGSVFRLKDLCNVTMTDKEGLVGEFSGQDLSQVRGGKGRIIQWVTPGSPVCILRLPDGSIVNGSVEGYATSAAMKGMVVQFERVGFCRLFKENTFVANFAHK